MLRHIIDFHTHAFPDELAASAMDTLRALAPGTPVHRDGTVASLLRSMDEAGIEKSVLCCIATKPEQFDAILHWCGEVRSERLVPFPSVHPSDRDRIARLRRIKAEGFRGIKMHPYYQDFYVGEDRMLAFYEEVSRLGLVLVTHSGFDMAFPRERRADPESLLRITETFPELRLVTAHLGGWQQWDEVRRYLLGRRIYMEMSFAMQELAPTVAREMLMAHPAEYLLFGSDSPWTDQRKTVGRLEQLRLPAARLERLVRRNAEALLIQADGLL